MDDELHERLERMGQAATPSPDEQFAGRLESHLRATAATSPARRGPVLLRPGLVLGALLLIALAVGALVLGSDDDPDVLVIDDAAGATIVVPGGEPVTGAPGTELPDGTVIEVGPDGFAVIDGIVLPAGSEATVVMGVVELRLAPPTPAPTAVPPTTPVEPPPTAAPTSTPFPTALPTDVPTSTPLPAPPSPDATPDAPATTPEPEPTPTARPTTAPSATPTPQPTATAQPTPTAEPEPTPTAEARPTVTLERANLGPRRAQLTWTVTGADAIAGFEIRIRRGDEVRTAAVLRDPSARALTVERPHRDRVFYRVVARDAEGEIVARSDEVRVTAAG